MKYKIRLIVFLIIFFYLSSPLITYANTEQVVEGVLNNTLNNDHLTKNTFLPGKFIIDENHLLAETSWVHGEMIIAANQLPTLEKEDKKLKDGLLSGYTIVIDPGHGGKDPGAIGQNGVLEKDLILTTSLKIAESLEKSGANVILTRVDDSFVSLHDRVFISNQNNADAFISIHFNAFSQDYVGGINTYYHLNGEKLAHTIQDALANEVLLRNRGVIQKDYRVLRDNQPPAILIELGFITNTTELATLQTESYQDKVARAITNGLIDYFREAGTK